VTIASRWSALLDSLRTVVGTGLDIVRTRVELFGIELEQELLRTRSLIVRSVAALLLIVLAAGFAGFAVIVVFWESHRQLAAALVAAFFALLAAVAVGMLKRFEHARQRPFAATLEVLENDSDSLRGLR
jgi:uncharacterized membrane protein YqjE